MFVFSSSTYISLMEYSSLFCSLVFLLAFGVITHVLKFGPVDREISDQVLTPGHPQKIAHKGGAHEAPENTIIAIQKAKENGADSVEIDVGFSKEGIAVLIHDETVDRTTDGSGCVSEMSLQELQKLDAALHHPTRTDIGFHPIPSLQQAVEESLRLGLKIYFDIKGCSHLTVKALTELFSRHPELYSKSIVCSFYPMNIIRLRYANPKIVTAFTSRRYWLTHSADNEPYTQPGVWKVLAPVIQYSMNAMWRPLCRFMGVSAVLLHSKMISRELIEDMAYDGISVIAWTVNSQLEKDYLSQTLNISYITDCVKPNPKC